jgi:hypothetical protein
MRVSSEAAFKDDGRRTFAGASQVDPPSVVEMDKQVWTVLLGSSRRTRSLHVRRAAGADERDA